VPSASDQFPILTAASRSGAFANVVGGHLNFGGGQFDVLYSPTGVTLTNFQPVPEPAAGVALFAAVASSMLRRARRSGNAPQPHNETRP